MSGEAERGLKYRQIADEIRQRIEAGDLAPGDRLPGENALMERYGVARMTARSALGVLQAEGLTVARKGAGVFVRELRPIRRHSIGRVASTQWAAGRSIWEADIGDRTLVVDDIQVEEVTPPPAVGAVLDTERCVERRRRYVLDGEPVMLAMSWLPADLVASSPIAQPDTGPGGIYARLAELGHAPVRFREELRSRMPTPDEAQRLHLAPATPVVVIYRTAFTAEATAIEVNEMILDSSAYVIEYSFDDPGQDTR